VGPAELSDKGGARRLRPHAALVGYLLHGETGGGFETLIGPNNAGRRFVGEAAGERAASAGAGGTTVAGGWDQQMLFKVGGEGAEDGVRVSAPVDGGEEAAMETDDGHADGAHGALSAVLTATAVLPLELGDGLQLAKGFLFYWFGLVFVVEDGFEFFLFAQQSDVGDQRTPLAHADRH